MLVLSIVTLVMDWILQVVLVLRYGPRQTRDLVIAEFKKKEVAREVREALDLPDRAALSALQTDLKTLDALKSLPTDVQAVNARFDAIQKEIKELPATLALTDAQLKGIGDAVGKSVRGMLGKEGQEISQADMEFFKRYSQNPQAVAADKESMYRNLVAKGVPENMAYQAVNEGPDAVGAVLRRILGQKNGRLVDDIRIALPLIQKQMEGSRW